MFSKAAQRVSTTTSRMAKRFNSYQSGSEGATAASRGSFGEKEKAVENQWARSHDADKIKALRDALQKQEEATKAIKKDLEELQKKHESK
ncbi:hypothetical protein K501DRAFT_249920 [Backusella circina FSU 941]|nr:hypothetical protein K501DRAFT_249920 [Backusella circina FSU 941]